MIDQFKGFALSAKASIISTHALDDQGNCICVMGGVKVYRFCVPRWQGEQMFVVLKRLRVDTEMVRFPEGNHGLYWGGHTDRRIVRQ